MPPIIDPGVIFLTGALKHFLDCLKMFSVDIDGNVKYWVKEDEVPVIEDGVIKIKLEMPSEDLAFWMEANAATGVERFKTAKQWRERIQEKVNE